ncbi:hypothetical protein PR048_016590 [Dryococelus australis]|uniref:Uncharacterized protein n=1 Tax=Dryococelus australis TaxID=614101 RepID=A0ABQ9H752_9NEOP|nr:hypothetical protein PR048_016590 [Dryococelus australis]
MEGEAISSYPPLFCQMIHDVVTECRGRLPLGDKERVIKEEYLKSRQEECTDERSQLQKDKKSVPMKEEEQYNVTRKTKLLHKNGESKDEDESLRNVSEYPRLGATSDGVREESVTSDGVREESAIVNIKCPSSAKYMFFRRGFTARKLKFLCKENNTSRLKEEHPYFYKVQVMGQSPLPAVLVEFILYLSSPCPLSTDSWATPQYESALIIVGLFTHTVETHGVIVILERDMSNNTCVNTLIVRGSDISRQDTVQSSTGWYGFFDWLKHVGAMSELRNPEWLGQMRKRHQQPIDMYCAVYTAIVSRDSNYRDILSPCKRDLTLRLTASVNTARASPPHAAITVARHDATGATRRDKENSR